jgi:hypothetical protein
MKHQARHCTIKQLACNPSNTPFKTTDSDYCRMANGCPCSSKRSPPAPPLTPPPTDLCLHEYHAGPPPLLINLARPSRTGSSLTSASISQAALTVRLKQPAAKFATYTMPSAGPCWQVLVGT